MKAIILALAIGMTATANAQDQQINCDEPRSTFEINYCAIQELNRVDSELNRVYRAIIADLDKQAKSNDEYESDYAKQSKARLLTAQRAWVTFKEANAQLAGIENLGGTAETASVVYSEIQATVSRTKELTELFGAY